VLLAALAATLCVPAGAAARDKWDTEVLAIVPKPGFPAHAYVHPNGRIYAGTYDNPSGDTVASRVFEYTDSGTLLRSWTVRGQDLSGPHGVQAATSDARGRLVLLDKSPPRALLLERGSGRQTVYASFPEGSIPNYATWGPDGSLYVTDYGQPILWRIPPHGGEPEPWLSDARLDGGEFGTTGLGLAADRRTLLVATQSEAGGAAGNPTTGRLWTVTIDPDGKPGEMEELWASRPADGPDGFAIARSGAIYMTLLVTNQIAVIGPDGAELERFPQAPGMGENGSPVPFDSPSSARFLGRRLIVAQQSYFMGDPSHHAILDVEAGEPGLPELIPPNAGPREAEPDEAAPRITRIRFTGKKLRFRLSERTVFFKAVARLRKPEGGRRHVSIRGRGLGPGRESLPFALKDEGRWRVRIKARDRAGNRTRLKRRVTIK
jgi:sugar lactone lactonase YvrE